MGNEHGSDWRKASYSNGSGACVEVGRAFEGVAVRDTKDSDGAVLRFTSEVWRTFATKIKG
jgi:Domain of unknown function (DUF397)